MSFIEPEDEDINQIIKNALRKMEIPTAPTMHGKRSRSSKHGVTRSRNDDHTSKLMYILEAEESNRLRMEGFDQEFTNIILQEKECNSPHHYKLVHKFNPMPHATKIPEAKMAMVKE